MNLPLVSIIVPCYNVESYLQRCVESLVAQTYKNVEIILVDDGSTDSTSRLCDKYSECNSNIIVKHQENQGLSEARNTGIQMANGEFLTFIDSDDFVSADYVEHLYDILKKNNADVSVSQFSLFYDDSVVKKMDASKCKTQVLRPHDAVKKMFYQELFDTTACAKLYKSSLFSDIKYPSNLLFEDLATTYKLLLKANIIVVSNYSSYYYYMRSNSIEGSTFSIRKYDSMLAVVKQLENDHLLLPIGKSVKCRIFSFVLHIYMGIPDNYEEKALLWRKIKMLRFGVLTDWKARRKARVAAMLSYFGNNALLKVYNRIKDRK